MREKLEQIRRLADEILQSMGPAGSPPPMAPTAEPLKFASDWPALRRLLDSKEWPQAVFASQIADESSERDKEDRASGICEIILPPLGRKRFLDFGCGEGHVAKAASREAALSVGYDIEMSPKSQLKWGESQESLLLTTDFEKVRSMGPYDLVLLYDVVDHARGESPADILSKVSEVLADDGRVYMRCHPWCGRHGGHAYRKLNKAFVHLVLEDIELASLGVEVEHNMKVTKPLQEYSDAIKASGLRQASEPEIDSQEVEGFFRDNEIVARRILRRWSLNEWGDSPPAFQMSQCFIDYVLKKK